MTAQTPGEQTLFAYGGDRGQQSAPDYGPAVDWGLPPDALEYACPEYTVDDPTVSPKETADADQPNQARIAELTAFYLKEFQKPWQPEAAQTPSAPAPVMHISMAPKGEHSPARIAHKPAVVKIEQVAVETVEEVAAVAEAPANQPNAWTRMRRALGRVAFWSGARATS
jgi:hypothetical protein